MKASLSVWGLIAFSILGFRFLPKAETFILQDFESNFEIVSYPEEFLPGWSANEVRTGTSRVFQAAGEGLNGSHALGIQTIGSFDAQIYVKTSTIGLKNNNISFFAKTLRNGTGTRPVLISYRIFDPQTESSSETQFIGDDNSFPNEDTAYQEYGFTIPGDWMELSTVTLIITVHYGEGSGSAARLFIDNFSIPKPLTNDPEDVEQMETFKVEQVTLHEDKALILEFSQELSSLPQRLVLSPEYGEPTQMEIVNGSLLAWFEEYLYPNRYSLVIDGVLMKDSDDPVQLTHDFELLSPLLPGSLLINEFMADPNPKALPPPQPTFPTGANDEYIELWNSTDKPMLLKGLTYNGNPVEEIAVEAGEYFLLTPATRKESFTAFAKVAGVSGFRALPNNSGHISIKDAFEDTVDSLAYDTSWYGDAQKSQGGWSLERINPYLICSDATNWRGSAAPMGGTPGDINSVYSDVPDERPFEVISVMPLNDQRLMISFSKPLPSDLDAGFMGDLDGAPLILDSLGRDQLWARLDAPMRDGLSYRLEFQGFYDCNGQSLTPNFVSFTYDTQAPLIHAISGLDKTGFLVHFNKSLSDHPITLKQLSISQNEIVKSRMEMDSILYCEVKEPMEINRGYIFTVVNVSDLSGNIADSLFHSWTWEDHLDTVYWVSPTVLGVKFGKEVIAAAAKNRLLYTLDRDMGHPEKVSWIEETGVFHLFFAKQFPTNTSMTLTVQNIKDLSGEKLQTLRKSFTWDTRAISVSAFLADQPGKFNITFNKSLDPKWAAIPAHYQVNNGVGEPKSVKMISADEVALGFQHPWEQGQNYRLSIRQLKDLFGQPMNRTINLDFVWDTLPPVIDSVHLLSPYRIELYLSKPIKELDEVLVNGKRMEFFVADKPYILESKTPLPKGLIEINIFGAKDEKGRMLEPLTYQKDHSLKAIGEARIWGEKEVQLMFTQYLQEDHEFTPDQFSINGLKPEMVRKGDLGYDCLLSLSNSLQLNGWLQFTYSLQGNDEGIPDSQISLELLYDDAIQDIWVENSKSISVVQQVPLDDSDPWLGDFKLLDNEVAVFPILNQSDPTRLQLVMDGPMPEAEILTLKIPPRKSKDGKWLAGSTRTLIWDPNPPRLMDVRVISAKEFILYFDKPLSPVFAVIPQFYSLEGQSPVEAVLGESSEQVLLVFIDNFEDSSVLSLELSGLEDMNGNVMEDTHFEVIFDPPRSPAYRELVINEIMPAPRPNQKLPNAEYIEIYNPSVETIYLGGMKIGNSRSNTHLPRSHLSPNSYLILCPMSQVAAFEGFGEVLGLSSWPTLLNAGDHVTLFNADGEIIDELVYTTESFGGSTFAQGGYSLEVVNPYYACADAENIQVSVSPDRGTPGKVNSLYGPEQMPQLPRLSKVEKMDANTLSLHFTKPVFNVSQAAVEIDPNFEVEFMVQDSVDPSIILVKLKDEIRINQFYTIKATNFRDCSGEELDQDASLAHLILPGEPEPGDVVINEVLFNPRLGTPKFVELYNASDHWVNLKQWKLANVSNDQISNRRAISTGDMIVPPDSYLVFTPDPDQLYQVYPQGVREQMKMLVLPSYPMGSGSVVLLDPNETFVERFDYHEKMHHGYLRDVRGGSLERYSARAPVDDPSNWHSASATSGFATPGRRNSSVYLENPLEKGLHISPEVFIPDAAGEIPFTTISYKMDNPGYMATLRIYGVTGRMVRELCHNVLWGQEGFYTWDGTDAKGARVSAGYYILWAELYHPSGQMHQIKKTVVVASKLR